MSRTDISNSDDVIDSRDVIARIAELEAELGPVEESDGTDNDERAELAALVALADEAEGYAEDWKYGATLVRDSYFTAYAMEMLKDIGDLPKDIPWYVEIDEEKTAANIQQDYTSVEFDGVTYWVR